MYYTLVPADSSQGLKQNNKLALETTFLISDMLDDEGYFLLAVYPPRIIGLKSV